MLFRSYSWLAGLGLPCQKPQWSLFLLRIFAKRSRLVILDFLHAVRYLPDGFRRLKLLYTKAKGRVKIKNSPAAWRIFAGGGGRFRNAGFEGKFLKRIFIDAIDTEKQKMVRSYWKNFTQREDEESEREDLKRGWIRTLRDRKSTRLNSSH